jgi:hypothetical protein
MHPLIREYAAELLDASGERAELESRHASAMARLAEAAGAQILGAGGPAAIRRLDLEQHNVRAAADHALAGGDTGTAARVIGSAWRWFQQRGRLQEGRTYLARVLEKPPEDARLHVLALGAEGGLAYWADDGAASARAYETRLRLAEELGDPGELGEAHYDLGFIAMVRQDPAGLRRHEQEALDRFLEVGNDNGVLRARQALGLAVFLSGDYSGALELESKNLEAFRAAGAGYQIADSMTFHAGVYFRANDPTTAWGFVLDGLRWFAENENVSGIARALGMAAIVSITFGDTALAELGARAAGATYELMREKGVMLAPVTVLHLPDPRGLAVDRLGVERAQELLDEGAATPLEEVIEAILAAPAPAIPGGGPPPAGAGAH